MELSYKNVLVTGAAGFIGLFGYLGRVLQAAVFGWMADHFGALYGNQTAWNIVLWTTVGCGLLSVLLLAFTWKLKPKA